MVRVVAGIGQLEDQRFEAPRVGGSSPSPGTTSVVLARFPQPVLDGRVGLAGVVQQVEQRFRKPQVAGSIPVTGPVTETGPTTTGRVGPWLNGHNTGLSIREMRVRIPSALPLQRQDDDTAPTLRRMRGVSSTRESAVSHGRGRGSSPPRMPRRRQQLRRPPSGHLALLAAWMARPPRCLSAESSRRHLYPSS